LKGTTSNVGVARALALASAIAISSLAVAVAVAAEEPADLVVVNAKVWTGDSARPEATALAVSGERLVAVGSDAEVRALIGPATRTIDGRGRRLVPGFIDGHTHFVEGGFELLGVDLRLAPSREEFVRRFGEHAAKVPAGRWILAATWDHERWPGAPLPRRDWIDAVSFDHPVIVSRTDGHMALANSRALALAGITRATPDPPGGTIVRDPATGEPTGVLKDAAMSLVYAVVPPRSDDELEDALRAAMAHAVSLGVTSVQDMTLWEQWPAMQRLRDQGALTVRLYARTPIASWQRQRDLVAKQGAGDAWLRLGGFKGYVDGSLGSSTALFFEPYADAPETAGIFADDWFPEGTLERRAAAADAAGFQLSVHAIGERANAEILDLFARVATVNGARDRRLRVEHAQHLRRIELERFGPEGVVASMQPYHAADDGRWADKRLGPERSKDSYVFRSLLDAGAKLVFGSDWPVAPLSPVLGLAAAVTRRTLDGENPGGWHPEEKISVAQALTAYTAAAAWAEFAEEDKGTLATGKLADFVLLGADPFAVDPAAIESVEVDLTVVGGRVVHERR
jgi:predicted amidohydrolase YtcJ